MAEEEDDAAAATSSPAPQFDDDSDGLPRLLSLNHNSRRSSQTHYDPDDDPSTSSPPASPSSANPQKERGRLRIHNVGGSLTFLLQVLSLSHTTIARESFFPLSNFTLSLEFRFLATTFDSWMPSSRLVH